MVVMEDWISIVAGDSVLQFHSGGLRPNTTYIINISHESESTTTGPISGQVYAVSGIAGLGLHHDLIQQGKNWVTRPKQRQYDEISSAETSPNHPADHAAGNQVLTALLTARFLPDDTVGFSSI